MCHANNEKRTKRSKKRNRTTTSGKNQNAWREWNITRTRKYWKQAITRWKKNRKRRLPENKLCRRINTRTISPVGHGGPLLKWPMDEIRQINQRTRKSIVMDMKRRRNTICVSRKGGSIEDFVDATIRGLEEYIKKKLTKAWRTWEQAEQLLANWNGKKTSCMDISYNQLES